MTVVTDESVIWHDVECGGYGEDLPLWRELADAAPGPVLELGCGTGRVALDLAARGGEVTAVDSDAALVRALRDRAADRGIALTAEVADARTLNLPSEFGLIAAPMQMVQLLVGSGERTAALAAAASALAPGGRIGLAIVEGVPDGGGELAQLLPDVAEIDGWVYSSLPLEIADEGDVMRVVRLRQVVSPGGDLRESTDVTRLAVLDADQLEHEAREAGLSPAGRRAIATTDDHVGSTVVLLEA
jgi:SAM-dependent methyltransferase